MSFSIKNLGFNKVAILENGKQIHVCSGPNSVNEAKQYISESYAKTAPKKAVKRGNIAEVVAEMQSIQDNIESFEMSMVEGYTAEQINTLIESYSSFAQTNEQVQNPALTAWIGRHHYSQKTYVESMDEPTETTMPATDKWQSKEQEPKSFTNTVTRAASTITISQQKAGLYGHGPFGVTRDFETKFEPAPMAGKSQLAGPNESVETLDELSKKTLGSYVKGAKENMAAHANKLGKNPDTGEAVTSVTKMMDRNRGINKAVDRLTKEDITEAELDEMISEVLSKSTEAGKWIEDFVKSEDPKFAGKSKEKRKQMALAAYYAKQNEELELDEALSDEHMSAVKAFAAKHGKDWKEKLSHAWMKGTDSSEPNGHLLRQVRNQHGPSVLSKLKLEELETEEFELSESVDLNEDTAVHGKYTIKSGPAVTGMGEGSPEHVKGHLGKLKHLGISTEKGGKYGTTHRVSVTNNETGEKTHHHVYQREFYDKKPVVSVRDVGAGRKDQSTHHEVLKSYLSGKKADTAAVKEAVELGAEGDFKKAPKKFAKAPMQAKQGKPEGSLEVKEDLDEEMLDELSKATMKSYVEKGIRKGMKDAREGKGDISKKREAGLNKAMSKVYTKEELEHLDELSKATLGAYVKDASSDRSSKAFEMGYEAGAGRQPSEKAHAEEGKRRKGIATAVKKLTKESFADFIFDGEVIREELVYELSEADSNYDMYFREMMKKAGISSIADLKTADAKKEFMKSVDAGFKAKNEEYVVENFMRSDVEEKAAAHKKAGHKVSDVKFSTKDNKPHAEYTVTTTDGDKKKYIYHGTARKLETLA